jgi:hypothetical protein
MFHLCNELYGLPDVLPEISCCLCLQARLSYGHVTLLSHSLHLCLLPSYELSDIAHSSFIFTAEPVRLMSLVCRYLHNCWLANSIVHGPSYTLCATKIKCIIPVIHNLLVFFRMWLSSAFHKLPLFVPSVEKQRHHYVCLIKKKWINVNYFSELCR